MEESEWGWWLYLQIPATARRLMKKTKPAHTPASPNTGAAISRNSDETTPTSICGVYMYRLLSYSGKPNSFSMRNREQTIEYAAYEKSETP